MVNDYIGRRRSSLSRKYVKSHKKMTTAESLYFWFRVRVVRAKNGELRAKN